ncbi:acetate kinase [Rhodanobacter sp. 7MK24]|uniref:OmpH family outer membrane protein n=1 Tax=Rhodanobacter sp. 7MK24 TaxID=2775922 RepID=UPI001781B4E2|nr:OmpH family outer membrane protein [Rhodanobacter sp. 7MK24]MBD8882383.1 acetate kinase [Rhodanobacter sp. 7MK24]
MDRKRSRWVCSAGCAGFLFLGGWAGAQEGPAPATPASGDASASSAAIRKQLQEQDERINALRQQIDAQLVQLGAMRKELAQQQSDYRALRHAVGVQELEQQRGGNLGASGTSASTEPMPAPDAMQSVAAAQQPVGVAPPKDARPPEVAPISNQPGVLTPKGKLVIEPSYQFGYSSASQVDLVGYTVIPAILIGLIDVRTVRTTTQTTTLTARYGITNRLELELRVPYVWTGSNIVSREIFTGTATNNVLSSSGSGLGDIEATARYQFNDGGADKPYFIGWFRFKSRTGTDPFDVTTDCVTRCVENVTGTGLPLQLPTGSGFYSAQPGMTWLLPSDPVVFFGNLSYLYNFERHGVWEDLVLGRQYLGTVRVGNVGDASLGMGFALNDKATLSIGYDQSIIGVTKEMGQTVPGSTKVWLGQLLIGGAYRLSPTRTVNFTLAAGVTHDTPDVLVTVRVPMTF